MSLFATSGNPTLNQDTFLDIRVCPVHGMLSHALRAGFHGVGSWLPFLESARMVPYTGGALEGQAF